MAQLVAEGDDDLPEVVQIKRWSQLEESRSRRCKVAAPNEITPHALWELPSKRHSVCAANWLVGRFPPNREAARWYLGDALYGRMDLILRRTFIKERWSAEDKRRVVIALEKMSGYWPSLLHRFRSKPLQAYVRTCSVHHRRARERRLQRCRL